MTQKHTHHYSQQFLTLDIADQVLAALREGRRRRQLVLETDIKKFRTVILLIQTKSMKYNLSLHSLTGVTM